MKNFKKSSKVTPTQSGEPMKLTFMYWDGSSNRYSTTIAKSTTVSDFLAQARDILVKDFPVLKKVPSDLLLFVKGDMILPHFVTFYDLLIAEAQGRTGPILTLHKSRENDSDIDIDDAGVGKVLERKWYEKNRHIFPASQWVLYDPASSLK